ncbi:50S ribosomal protein L11 methyltransferase [Campylobacter ureolyticus]|uniref:50S ribosomal protein L11 methyltransferase n=1 Tax=Campylobacter ureolyticus TaxID=827 RepID=UPI001FC7CCC4|nr:50S ribosomal protein L11 methyltransferase [Campylobacter ureolyticus]MCZ6105138.1 50S ribosomal protein L11 methyltransferase [Campylobacter ureolyticus]MCZ6157830.1 50S ribosomal protein L11 methyltransferase [Campylobacter ureolyticus]GKH61103.1 ribosomal protein L11 methyltransferase [Campylobacter ureolyticus]
MKEFYFELIVKSNALEFFKNFAFEMGVDAVEFKDDFFIIRDEDKSSIDTLKFAFLEYKKSLEKALNLKIDLELKDEKKKSIDWIDEYKKGVQPVEVGEIYIHPSWEKPKEAKLNLMIDPALAFGSGHHESTNMCLALIQKYKNGYKSALDVGCGSGILSIALSKLGIEVSACDTDVQAVLATKENALKNGVELFEIFTGSVTSTDKTYDVVVANIIADVILVLKNDLIKSLNKGGVLILSGILEKYFDKIKKEFCQLELVESLQKNDWVSFVFKK